MPATEPNYGSDQNGLVWGYSFAPDRPPQEIDSTAAAALLGPQLPHDLCFLWLHFSLSNAAAERWLREHVSPPPGFFESLREGVGSTRLEQEEDALTATLHDVLFEFTFDPAQVSTVGLFVRPKVLVSVRLRPLRSIDRLRSEVRAGASFRSPAELLAQLLRDQAAVLMEIVRNTTQRVDTIEDSLLEQRVAVSRSQLGSLRRLLVRLQRLLAPEPAALFRLLGRPPAWIDDDDLRALREAAEEFSTAVAECAALVERARLIQEELGAFVSEATNRTLFLLTIVTVLALPFNVIGALMGMNVGGIPFAESPRGFAAIVALIVILTVVAAVLARRAGWFRAER
jgi:zinc transporter